MCINADVIIMVRTLINDLDSDNETYSDDRLSSIIAVSAKYVNKDLERTYTINISSPDITPDPVTQNDDTFINLLVMKTACQIDTGLFRTKAALAGLEARCGPAILRTAGHLDGFKEMLASGPCGLYAAMLRDYKYGSGELCHAVMGPFISNDFDPDVLRYTKGDDRLRD